MLPRLLLRSAPPVVVSVCLVCCVSCGSNQRKVYPVHGKVLVDGKPAEGAIVALYAQDTSEPLEVAPRGHVKADGSFAVSTFGKEDGAPAGEYKVTVLWLPPDAREQMMSGRFPNKLPAAYGDPKTSGLSVQVKPARNEVPPFELTLKK